VSSKTREVPRTRTPGHLRILFHEDFETYLLGAPPNSKDFTVWTGSWAARNVGSSRRMACSSSDNVMLAVNAAQNLKAFTLAATVRFSSADSQQAGFFFRAEDASNFYTFHLERGQGQGSATGWAAVFGKIINGSFARICGFEIGEPVDDGKDYQVKIWASGTAYEFYVDKGDGLKLGLAIIDSTLTGPHAGLRGYFPDASWDNLVLTDNPVEPDCDQVQSVRPPPDEALVNELYLDAYANVYMHLYNLPGKGSGRVSEYVEDPANPDSAILAKYHRVWVYTQALALLREARLDSPNSPATNSHHLADWLRSNVIYIDGRPEGWNFSQNIFEDYFRDPRLITGANAWATKALGAYILSPSFRMRSDDDRSSFEWLHWALLQGLISHQRRDGLFTAGLTFAEIQVAEGKPEYDSIVTKYGYSPLYEQGTRVKARNVVVTEHNSDMLNLLNQALFNSANLGLSSDFSKLLRTTRNDLVTAMFSHLYNDDARHFITGRLGDYPSDVQNPNVAVDNNTWFSLAVDYGNLTDEQVNQIALGLDFTLRAFVKWMTFDEKSYYAAHYFTNAFSDLYLQPSNLYEACIHIEATCSVIQALNRFADFRPAHCMSGYFRASALNLWNNIHYWIADERFPYSSKRVPGVMTFLQSATSAIWYMNTSDYVPRTKQIVLPNFADLVVFVQDRQTMKVGRPAASFRLEGAYPLFSLPIDWTKNQSLAFPMDGNDLFGDCLYAAACHADNTFTGNLGAEEGFDPNVIINDYLRLSGGNNGLNEGQIVEEWRNGLANTPAARIFDVLNLNPNDSVAMQAAIYFFGGALFMLDIPDKWRTSFATGAIWDAPAIADRNNGHGVWWNGVNTNGNYRMQTWGTYGWITPSGVAVCDPSCFVVFSPRWFDDDGVAPNGLSYFQLAALWQQFGGGVLPMRNRVMLPDESPLEPAIASVNGYLCVAYKGMTSHHIYLASSRDGLTFGNTIQSGETATQSPSLCAHTDGKLYLAFQAEMSTNVMVVPVTIGANGDINTGPAVMLPDESPLKPAIASVNGYLCVAYKGMTSDEIYFISSRDGMNFENRFQSFETTPLAPALSAHSDNALHICFRAEASSNIVVGSL
jgi:hypothetical protein